MYTMEDDMPIAIYEKAERCAEILGVDVTTFRAYLSRQRHGVYYRGVQIYRDGIGPDEELPPNIKRYGLKPIDFRILGLKIEGIRQNEIARRLGRTQSDVCRRLARIARKYGFAPWKEWTVEQFKQEEEKYFAETVGK
jgi:hypothetical protein